MAESKSEKFTGYAVVKKGNKFEPWSYVPRPLGDYDVQVKISHCGICHSDLHTVDSGWGPTIYPVIVGHEIIGTVAKIGKAVSGLAIGNRVGVGVQVFSCLDKSKCKYCHNGDENHCPEKVLTYNMTHKDGSVQYGGYADNIRVHSAFVFKVPEALPSDAAAPLLCAGVTVFAPMLEFDIKAGSRVAVTGIGGLGHLAIQFASKLGAKVTAISHSTSKREDALKLGATTFIDSSDSKALEDSEHTFDMVLVTAVFKGMDWNVLHRLVDIRGYLVVLALPEEPMVLNAMDFVLGKSRVVGSFIGSIEQTKATLEFAAKHKILPLIDKFPLDKVNDAIDFVRAGKPRYRAVLQVQQ